jgi:RNA polymerase sigma-70 factor (ECF subfamily)
MARLAFDEFYESYFDRVGAVRSYWRAPTGSSHATRPKRPSLGLRGWRKVREMDRPDGWVYVVAMNQLRDRWRRGERRRERAPELADGAADNTSAVVTRLSVREAIATLPARQRQAVVLRYLADLSLADVADAMGCATGTVKATLHQAMQSMRVELDDDADR